MLDHRLVERRPIAVIVAIHPSHITRVAQLQQPATVLAVTFDQLERHLLHRLAPALWENTGQRLITQIKNRDELGVSTDATASDLSKHAHQSPGCSRSCSIIIRTSSSNPTLGC